MSKIGAPRRITEIEPIEEPVGFQNSATSPDLGF